jgi:hypothetical protein
MRSETMPWGGKSHLTAETRRKRGDKTLRLSPHSDYGVAAARLPCHRFRGLRAPSKSATAPFASPRFHGALRVFAVSRMPTHARHLLKGDPSSREQVV